MSISRFQVCILLLSLFILSAKLHAQEYLQKYYPETDPLVIKQIEKWQDIKFGLLMHWGPYSQWGIVESWSICSEDEGWCARKTDNYVEYKKEYENLKKTFNPTKFDPSKWAEAASNAGMKYVIFTTKHHDGFCMFDTKQTDYKITDKETPFSINPKANVTKEIFDAFRKKGFMTGAYFSKPDWHSENYWWSYFATPDRNVNYQISKYPERWKKFVEFTHNQIMELMTDYGRVDILWLDGGWVRVKTDAEVREQLLSSNYAARPQSQDINMPELVRKAREKQPGLIVVDRAVEGPYQNYLTPENQVPGKLLPYPWESCIIMGGGWSYAFDAKYKTPHEVVHLLVDIVSKGGNLLLNIAPSPEGTWDEEAYATLKGVGEWMNINSDAIYNSRPLFPYQSGKICFTQNKNDKTIYATYFAEKDEAKMPEKILVEGISPGIEAKVFILGSKEKLNWKKVENGFEVEIPKSLQNKPPCINAWVIKVSNESL
ncbi:MAG: alpha-L-fucosidase [Stygiobacter sp. GWC2_38_9]|nr:MAG: alpha-L-fucosidase [Stygiobacter sp. GWC2_38_9]